MSSRVAIVGAGHHGLAAAIRLAAAGCEVAVLEASAAPGGGVRTDALTLPGFRHDSCSGFFPLTAASPVFRALELDLEWVNPPTAMAHVVGPDGAAIALHRDIGATVDSLNAVAPRTGRGWRALMDRLSPHRDALISAVLSPLPALLPLARLLLGLRADALKVAPIALASSARLGRQLFGDDRAAAWLAGSGAHADLSPLAAGSGAFSLGLQFLGHVVGWPFPRGGAGALTDALVSRLSTYGGELRCGARVEQIELRGGRVAGVRLSGGELLSADGIIATVSPAPLLELLPANALPGRVELRLRRWEYGLGTLKLDYALSGPVPWLSSEARRAGVVHVGGALEEIITSLDHASSGRLPERPTLVVGQQSLHDHSRAPERRHTLYVYARVPSSLRDGEGVAAVERQLERFAPGFRALVLARSVRGPEQIEGQNNSMRGGDLASGSCRLRQQLMFRPAPALCRGRTPVPGLLVAGAWVHPGPGVHGVSGHAAAGALLTQLRSRGF
jgi:phytoene dehydrogenase-like protein